MPDDELNRERAIAYSAGYSAGSADATCGVVLTEEERDAIEESSRIVAFETHNYMTAPGDIDGLRELVRTLDNILARSAQPADTVTVRREVLAGLVGMADSCRCVKGEYDAKIVLEAEAALAKGLIW